MALLRHDSNTLTAATAFPFGHLNMIARYTVLLEYICSLVCVCVCMYVCMHVCMYVCGMYVPTVL
jgi:hypothetical protein